MWGDSDFISSGSDEDDYTPRNLNSQRLDDFVMLEGGNSEEDEIDESFTLPSCPEQPQMDENEHVGTERYPFRGIQAASMQHPSAYTPKHIRVIVHCGPHSLLLPCIDDDIASRKTIAWLKTEIKRRCTEMYQGTPDITRLLTNGAILFDGDAVTEVLGDEQVVECQIAAWSTLTPLERYVGRGELVLDPVRTRLIGSIGSVDLSCLDLVYDHDHLRHLLSCLSQCHTIDLSENNLDDRALNLITLVLLNSSDTRLNSLNLSGNMIKGEGIHDFVSGLRMTTVSVDLSFNPLLPIALPPHPRIKAEHIF